MVKKLHLNENFDNVQVDVQAVADPVFVNANKEHDENKEKYEDALEANKENAESTIPEEGESIEVEKRDVLKKMHLSESLFTEDVDDIDNIMEEVKGVIETLIDENVMDALVHNVHDTIPSYDIDWAAEPGDYEMSEHLNMATETLVNALMDYLFENTPVNESLSESMEEIDRQVFGSLNKETKEPGVYYVLVDQNFDRKIYADSDEEAIEKFRAELNEEKSLTEETSHRYINIDDLADIKYSKLYDAYNCGAVSLIIYGDTMHNEKFDTELMEENNIDSDEVLDEINEFAKDLGVKFVLDSNYVESLNESAKAFSPLELEIIDVLRANDYKIYPTAIEAYADYIETVRKETGEEYTVSQWFKDTEGLSPEESELEKIDENLNESVEEEVNPDTNDLDESLIYNVAKEQLKRFNEGKMGDNWNPKTYLERLASKKYLNEEQIKKLNENFHVVDLEDGESFGDYEDVEDAKAKAVQYTSMFNTKAAVVDDDNNVVDGFDKDGNSLK